MEERVEVHVAERDRAAGDVDCRLVGHGGSLPYAAVPDRLTPEEAAALAGATSVRDLRRLTGGASRETYSLVATFADGSTQRLALRRDRPGGVSAGAPAPEEALLRAAARAGVPVPPIVAGGDDYLVTAFVEGETIPRRILRDDAYAGARDVLAAQCGRALAGIHSIPVDEVPGLQSRDEVTAFRDVLDATGQAHPAFELAFRWLDAHRPPPTPGGERVVHGDFRNGNLIVGPDGLRAVLDWEIAHLGDPMEDLAWLCVKAWRFGVPSKRVGGFGDVDDLVRAYTEASGIEVDLAVLRWWEVLGTLKWGIMCIVQAFTHLSGAARSVELATIGRRVCENEWDLLELLDA
jgi:aminoglycoside phosphotransferase (APT) family kinase protein